MTNLTKTILILCLAMCGCPPVTSSVNRGSGVPDSDLWKYPCRDEPDALPGMEKISLWGASKGPCGPDQGFHFPASAMPTTPDGRPSLPDITVKLNHLVAKVQPGETVRAFVDYKGPALLMRLDEAAKFYTQERPFQEVGSTEFPKRWTGEFTIPSDAVGAERSIELLIRCKLAPCTVGRFGFLRKPAPMPAPGP
jgi:hypothetical protein